MRLEHIRSVDLNLLPVLDALLRHRSVTAAAEAVNLSQPATSRALGRLRALLGDPLLVRSPRGFMLSERAAALQPELATVLQDITGLLVEKPLDPATEKRTFRIAMSDAHAVLLMPSLIARLARDAPGLTIAIVPYGPDITDRMAAGQVDVVLALATTPLPPGATSQPLLTDELAVVIGQRHPRAQGPWRFEDYARWPSVAISLLGDGTSDLDTLLAREGVTRRFASVVPNFTTALSIVGATEAVTTISRLAANRFRDMFGLVVLDAPFGETSLPMTLVTSATRRGDRLLDWLCAAIGDGVDRAPVLP